MSDTKPPQYTAKDRPIEKETRPLPKGWVTQFDEKSQRFFFVDTNASPPRSIWVHPFDDPEYIKSIPDTDNPQAQADQSHGKPKVTMASLTAEELEKMGPPEEYAKNHPPGFWSTKVFHPHETAKEREERHAKHRARNVADSYGYRAPMGGYGLSPYSYYGYGPYYGMGMNPFLLGYGGMGMGMGMGGLMW